MIEIIGLILENDYPLKIVMYNMVCDISDYINIEDKYAV